MADLVSYNMGQIRWQKELSLYREDLEFSAHSIETISLGDKKYLDLVFHPNSLITFSQDESYYLKLDIPRNLSFDMTFDLKMLEASMINNNPESFSISDRNQYQEIKRFVVARQVSNISEYSRVVLYPSGGQNKDGTPVVTIAKEPSDTLNNGDVYYDSSKEKYFIKKPNEDIEIWYKNDVLLNHTWKADRQTEDKASVEFVFSNKVAGKSFNCLLLELNRNSNDDDISHGTGGQYSGLYVNPDQVGVTCYRLKNMIDIAKNENNTIKAFNNIGVWSHPDAIMAINGEEIRVGQSGYYELNDFDITNFGMVIRDSTDKFSLDYQYKVSNVTS